MRRLIPWILAIVAFIWLWRSWMPISHPAGVLVTAEPEQTLFSSPQPIIPCRGWTLKPLAMYTIQARVLSITHYSGDPDEDLAPYDLAVGWGPMSDTAVLEKLDISQGGRFYRWQYWGAKPPILEHDIITHSANMHIIHEDDQVLARLKSLRKGSVVRMTGYLVEANHPRAVHPWRSSLSREDTGEGACEIMYVRLIKEVEGGAH